MDGICAECGDRIRSNPVREPDQALAYCSRWCCQRAAARSLRREEHLTRLVDWLEGRTGPVCPHEFKAAYPHRGAAWRFIAGAHLGDARIGPYECVCGATHIGHHRQEMWRPHWLRDLEASTAA